MTSASHRLRRAKDLLKCPIDWSTEMGYGEDEEAPDSVLRLDWCLSCCAVAMSIDEISAAKHFFDFGEPPSEIDEATVKNLTARWAEAKALYVTRSGRLGGLRFVTPSEHGKHYRFGLDRQSAERLSRKGPSLFFRDRSELDLRRTFWAWFGDIFEPSDGANLERIEEAFDSGQNEAVIHLWNTFNHAHEMRIAFKTFQEIGASGGSPTQFIAFDLSIDSRVGHAYPISKMEAHSMMGSLLSVIEMEDQ